MLSSGFSALGINTPLYYIVNQLTYDGIRDKGLMMMLIYLAVAWTLGCCVFGCLVLQRSVECRIGRQYLCQVSLLICALSILALTSVEGYYGYVTFVWVYGIFIGGYNYTLKMYVYQKVRARNFARAWGYIQCSQALPNMFGIPLAGYINIGWASRAGYYFSATCVLIGSVTLCLIDVHKSNLRKKRKLRKMRSKSSEVTENCKDDHDKHFKEAKIEVKESLNVNSVPVPGYLTPANSLEDLDEDDDHDLKLPEHSHFSEEGIADMFVPDDILDELEYLDNITSCDKVENYLMLSEYEQNLIKEIEGPPLIGRKARKWSLVRQASSLLQNAGGFEDEEVDHTRGRRRDLSLFRSGWMKGVNNRSMNTIMED